MSDPNQSNQQGDDYHQREGRRQGQQGGGPDRSQQQQEQPQPRQEQVWQHRQWGSTRHDGRQQDTSDGMGGDARSGKRGGE
jgi:hypothetical protein